MKSAFNPIRDRVLNRDVLSGSFVNSGSAINAEIAAQSGLDWLLIDLEHGYGGEEALVPRLELEGLTVEDLDELSLRMASANAYIEQRLRPRIRVTAEEIQTTYHDLVVREMEAAGESAPPLEDVQGQVRQLLVERKLNDEIERWLESAAEQHEVTLFYRP